VQIGAYEIFSQSTLSDSPFIVLLFTSNPSKRMQRIRATMLVNEQKESEKYTSFPAMVRTPEIFLGLFVDNFYSESRG